MHQSLRIFSWVIVVVPLVGIVVLALLNDQTEAAVAYAVLSVMLWIGWGWFLSWLLGIRRRARQFMGMSIGKTTYLAKDISTSRVADVRRLLEHLYSSEPESTVRYGLQTPALFAALADDEAEIKSLQWSTFEIQSGRFENLPSNAVYMYRRDGEPYLIAVSDPEAAEWYDEESTRVGVTYKLHVYARTMEAGSRIIEHLVKTASEHSIYRGMLLNVGSGGANIRIANRPCIEKDRIILPEKILEVLMRGISTRLTFHELLQRHGHTSKTGILMHGVPGTGKTLVSKHLIGACKNYTAIVPGDMEMITIREVFRMAAYLQPALVVIEDVDLLAQRRETNANVTGLQELMNEMDGLAPSTEAIVLMTTNRPEILEPALASRPGRVSQAIEFPLPDAELRNRILGLFCESAQTSGVKLEHWVARTEGASPAFLEELVKRAIIFAAERTGAEPTTASITLTDDDFDEAIHEMVIFGGKLTNNILGFPISDTGDAVL